MITSDPTDHLTGGALRSESTSYVMEDPARWSLGELEFTATTAAGATIYSFARAPIGVGYYGRRHGASWRGRLDRPNLINRVNTLPFSQSAHSLENLYLIFRTNDHTCMSKGEPCHEF
jgi:hypothetical protein